MRRNEMTVRFDADERAVIDRLAKQNGVSAAAAVRMLVRGAMNGETASGPGKKRGARKAGGK